MEMLKMGKSSFDYVKEYTKKGYSVFPLQPHTKDHIRGSKGYNDATNDWNILSNYFYSNTNSNVGLYLLDKEIVVIDIDRHGKTNGFLSLFNLEQDYGELPETYTVTTPRNGEHRYFKTSGLLFKKDKRAFREGIDILSSHINAPPTYVNKVYDGELIKGSYSVKNGSLDDLAELPQWFIQLIIEHDKAKKNKLQTIKGKNQPPQGKTWTGVYLDTLVDGVDEGSRNDWLTSRFGSFLYHKMDIHKAIALIHVVNEKFVNPPLDHKELTTIIESVIKRDLASKGGVN